MKKVLVTGAGGFLGQNLVRELLEQGDEVFAVLRDIRRFPLKHENLHVIVCGMEEYETLAGRKELRDIPIVFHLAWAGVSGPGSTDYALQLNNVKCACDLQTAAAQLGIRRFAFADSIMELEHTKAMASGCCRLPLRHTYHVAKLTARELLQLRCANAGMEFVPLLISNVYGPGENSPRLINTAIRALLAREHMSFTPSEQLYDFIYITDAVRAMALAGERGTPNRLCYIGSPEPRPLKDFLTEMRDELAPGFPLGIGELPFSGVSLDYTEFDTKLLYRDLGFRQEVPFRRGVRMTADRIAEKEAQA